MLVLAPNSNKFTNRAFKMNSWSPSAIRGAVEELLPYSASDPGSILTAVALCTGFVRPPRDRDPFS